MKIVKYFTRIYMTEYHETWQQYNFNHEKWRAAKAPEALWALCTNSQISGR
jgi:hypothetical protein